MTRPRTAQALERRPYEAPARVEHGELHKLTQNGDWSPWDPHHKDHDGLS